MSKKEKKVEEVKECQSVDNCNCSSECNCDPECHCSDNNDIELLTKRIKDLEEAALRSQAELVNYRRRKDDETTRMLKYANEDIILEFLPILDNFERAIKMDYENLNDEVSKFLEGFKMVYTQIKSMLEKFEVKEIDCSAKMFDENYHQAVMTKKDETKDSGIILEVLQKGYMYKDKVVRHSMVIVNE